MGHLHAGHAARYNRKPQTLPHIMRHCDLPRDSHAQSDLPGGVLAVVIRIVMSVPNILPQFACIRNALSGVETSCFFLYLWVSEV